ncbi:MGMT family protein [Candidatus Woesearchaeota archaeon]|nr:MGMT family protein [Candidatus Woesearchaeota archaeon]
MPTEFQERVYAVCRKVPKGKVTTYKAIADKLGTKAYRAVGTALACNPYAPKVPCHRIVNSDGSIGGFSGKGGVKGKIKMLRREGVEIKKNKVNTKKIIMKI